MGPATLGDSSVVSYKLTILLSYDPVITLLGIYTKDVKTSPHENLHKMFMEVLFIIAKTWKQPRCPLVGKWINCDTFRQCNIIQHYKK